MLLFLLMSALGQIWLLLPAGLLAGNGALMAITALTGIWRLWGWLWPVELILVGGLIVITINLGRRHSNGSIRQFARASGTLMALIVGGMVGLVIIGSIGAGILRAIFR
jgi:hypothetical protein